MGWRGNGPRKQWIMLRGLRGRQGTLKVSIAALACWDSQALILIHGRLWPCEADQQKSTIKRRFPEQIVSSQMHKAPESGPESLGESEMALCFSSLSPWGARSRMDRYFWKLEENEILKKKFILVLKKFLKSVHRKGLQQFVISEYYEKVFIVSNCQASFNSLFHDFFLITLSKDCIGL